MLNPVRVHYMFKTGGARGMALGAAMTERFFRDLVERGAEAVVLSVDGQNGPTSAFSF